MAAAAAQGCPAALPEGDCCRFLLKSPMTLCMLRRMLWRGRSPAGSNQQQEAPGGLCWAPDEDMDEGKDVDEERHKGDELASSNGRGLEPPRWGQGRTDAPSAGRAAAPRAAATALSGCSVRQQRARQPRACTTRAARTLGGVTRGRHRGRGDAAVRRRVRACRGVAGGCEGGPAGRQGARHRACEGCQGPRERALCPCDRVPLGGGAGCCCLAEGCGRCWSSSSLTRS